MSLKEKNQKEGESHNQSEGNKRRSRGFVDTKNELGRWGGRTDGGVGIDSAAGNRGDQIGELGTKVGRINGTAVGEFKETDRGIAWFTKTESIEGRVAKSSHGSLDRDIDDIVTQSAAVRITLEITSENSVSIFGGCEVGENGKIDAKEVAIEIG